MNDTTENFLKAMAEFVWPETKPIIYRLYHDDTGRPIVYTMEDLPGNYIDISKEDYWLASMESRVINGRLVHPIKSIAIKLKPSNKGTPCHPKNICVVQASEPNLRWSISSNEKN